MKNQTKLRFLLATLFVTFQLQAQNPDNGTCADVVSDTSGMTARYLIEVLAGGSCTDPAPAPEPCVPVPVICDDGISQDCSGVDEVTGVHPACPLAPPDPDPQPGGTIVFERIDTPVHAGGDTRFFGAYAWNDGVNGYAAVHDHARGGNDPIWRWREATKDWEYFGQLQLQGATHHAGIRHAGMLVTASGRWPVSYGPAFGSTATDMDRVHINGQNQALCALTKWWQGACQGVGDFDNDGVDDILRSNGDLLGGSSMAYGAETAAGTVIASGFDMFESRIYTKAVCIWHNRVLTDKGLFDENGLLVSAIPGGGAEPVEDETSPGIRGGFACGDFDGDGDHDVYYSEGGDDYTASGTAHLLRNNGNDTFTDVIAGSGLPAGGGIQRRYTISSAPDFNGDGCADLLLDDHGKVFQSGCDLTFVDTGTVIPLHNNKPQLNDGDFNIDGKPDFCGTTNKGQAICFRNITQ